MAIAANHQPIDGEGNIFILDQNLVDFGKLLDYGKIKVEDVDSNNVLILADYLGLKRLLLAVKVRWYCNIGKGSFAGRLV